MSYKLEKIAKPYIIEKLKDNFDVLSCKQNIEWDRKYGTDLVLMIREKNKNNQIIRISCRARRFYAWKNYPNDVTFRDYDCDYDVEWDKICQQNHADYNFYCFLSDDESRIVNYNILDMNKVFENRNRIKWRMQSNNDGTGFRVGSINDFKKYDCLIKRWDEQYKNRNHNKEIEINMNVVKYIDCMDKKEGLPSLPDQSIELCLTDPPYGIGYIGEHGDKDVNYDDVLLTFEWLDEILRVCKGIIFTPGMPAMYKYIKYKEPKNLLRYAYYPGNGKRTHVDPILTYGTISRLMHMRDIKEYKHQTYEGFIHPSPKSRDLWSYILTKLKPKSVLDPFIGSGTTAEICTKLNIPYLGYEINKAYKVDIDRRLRGCKKEPQQIGFGAWAK